MPELTAAEVAQKMLDMYQTEGDWCEQGLFRIKNGKEVYCLLGARVVIQYGNLGLWNTNFTLLGLWNTDSILRAFAGDEYLLKLAAIIREQHPELRQCFDPRTDLWDQLNVIFVFNDKSTFEDIRAVIEKAAAR